MHRLKNSKLKIRVDRKIHSLKIHCIKSICIVVNATPFVPYPVARFARCRLATLFPILVAATLSVVFLSGCSANITRNITQIFGASDVSANRDGKVGVAKQEDSGTSSKGSPDFGNKYRELGQLSPVCDDAPLRKLKGKPKGSSSKGAPLLGLFAVGCGVGKGALIAVDSLGGVRGLRAGMQTPFQLLDSGSAQVTRSAIDSSGRYVALAYGNEVEVVDLLSNSRIRLTTLKPKATALSFDAAGLAIGAADGRIYRWGFGDEHELERYVGPASVISAVSTHPSGRVFFSGDWDGGLNVWLNYAERANTSFLDLNLFPGRFQTEQGVRVKAVRADSEPIQQLGLDQAGAALFLTTQAGVLENWQVRGFYLAASVVAHQGLVYAMAVRSDGGEVTTAGRDGFVRKWSVLSLAAAAPGQKRQSEFKLLSEVALSNVSALAYLGPDVYAGDSLGNLQRLMWPVQ